jgi:hypothetical protein
VEYKFNEVLDSSISLLAFKHLIQILSPLQKYGEGFGNIQITHWGPSKTVASHMQHIESQIQIFLEIYKFINTYRYIWLFKKSIVIHEDYGHEWLSLCYLDRKNKEHKLKCRPRLSIPIFCFAKDPMDNQSLSNASLL